MQQNLDIHLFLSLKFQLQTFIVEAFVPADIQLPMEEFLSMLHLTFSFSVTMKSLEKKHLEAIAKIIF